ncbi:MAG: hypothetical protein K6T83_00265 [Alicyclobacillus sp.]|nr:hypothetical protein [Alicyclobacillus sp.]
MNWFAGIIASLLNSLAKGVNWLVNQALAGGSHLSSSVMANIILNGFFSDPNHVPAWGTGSFADLMDAHALQNLRLFSDAFWAIGWAFFLISIYLLVMQVAGARESATQRDRLKKGLVSLFVSAILIWAGPVFAVTITQLFFYLSDYFLNLNPLLQGWTPPSDGGQALLNSIVNLLQAVLSIIVWIVYQFRNVFLYVWMLFFPLAMAFFANDKTRGITKMWWTEWIYQMAVPFGQAVVFGVASAVASPAKSGAALTAADIFVALAGTIGLLMSAVYVRKLIELVAQNFGATLIGSGHGMAFGTAAMAGTAALTADVMGKASLKTARMTAGKGVGKLFQAVDNTQWARGKAKTAIERYGEVHAGAIQAGASVDDIMMYQKTGFTGDVLRSGGVGLETAAGGSSGSTGGALGGRGGSGSRGHGRQHVLSPIAHSRTAGEFRAMTDDVRNAWRNSNMSTLVGTWHKGFQNKGGVLGIIGDTIAAGANAAVPFSRKVIGDNKFGRAMERALGSSAQRHMADRTNKQERLEALRTQMKEVMEHNALATRLPGISHLYDPVNNTFQGMLSPAEKKYSEASQQFIRALEQSGMSGNAAQNLLQQAEQQWDEGKHLPNLHRYSPQAQQAYRQAFTAYRPAKLDQRAKDAVIAGKLTITPPKDPHKNQIAGTNAFLNDARNALMYRR